MGQDVKCSECNFLFCEGHNHHEGYSVCICRSCLSMFACPTQSPWGPSIGETIELIRIPKTGGKQRKKRNKQKTEPIPTGVSFIAEQGKVLFPDSPYPTYLVHYPIETVPCPDCNQLTLTLGFEDSEICPNCKTGILSTEFIEF